MILTVTLNSSVDKLYIVDEMQPFAVTRVRQVVNTAGGKGMNVSRVAALAGEQVVAMGFVGGHNGELFRSLIREPGIRPSFTQVQEETRCCVNVRDRATNHSTEFLEPGRPVSEAEAEQFLRQFAQELPGADVVVLSGSMPAGLPVNFYGRLVKLAAGQGKPVIVDTSGAALEAVLHFGPSLIKPNGDEVRQLLGRETLEKEELARAAQELRARGIGAVAISLGKDGVIYACDEGVYQGITPDIPVINTVGCGDSMVVGFAVAMARQYSVEETLRLAVAISTANALTAETGSFRQEDLERLLPQIEIRKLS